MKKSINTETNTRMHYWAGRYLPAYTILFLIIIWEAAVRIFKVKQYILPSPSSIMKVFQSTWRLILDHSLVTIYEALVGFGISIIIGLTLSFVMSKSDTVKRILYPLLVISQTIPIIAISPLIIIWLGVDILPKVVIVVLVCFFPICVSTIEGLQSADRDMINLMKIMGAGHFRIFKEVTLPSALPQFFAGLKIAATYSIMGAVIGEWLGAKSGLGIFMTRTMSSYRTDMLFAAIVVIVALSIGVFKFIELIEKIAIPWNTRKA